MAKKVKNKQRPSDIELLPLPLQGRIAELGGKFEGRHESGMEAYRMPSKEAAEELAEAAARMNLSTSLGLSTSGQLITFYR